MTILCPLLNTLLVIVLSRPEEPSDDHGKLEDGGQPQGAHDAKGRVGKDTAHDGACEKQEGGGGPAVPLRVVHGKQVLVGEQVTVDAGKDNAGERVVLEGTAGHGLAAALEGDESQRHEDVPAGRLVIWGRGADCDDGCSSNAQEGLRHEGDAENPSPLRGEEAVEAREEERSHAEAEQGDSGTPEASRDGREGDGGDSQTYIYRVS